MVYCLQAQSVSIFLIWIACNVCQMTQVKPISYRISIQRTRPYHMIIANTSNSNWHRIYDTSAQIFTETEMSTCLRNFPVEPGAKISSAWHFRFSVFVCWERTIPEKYLCKSPADALASFVGHATSRIVLTLYDSRAVVIDVDGLELNISQSQWRKK